MNGISMDNPMALLMNLNVGAASPMPSLMPMPEGGNVDLLGFVNALEVSQGPGSPIGEDLTQMTTELVHSDFEQTKLQSISEPNSGDLLSSMLMGIPQVPNSGDKPLFKTNNTSDVGRPDTSNLLLETASKQVTGETQLLGDLVMVAPKSQPANKTLNESDVALWSQAFAQNDIESIEVVAEQPSAVQLMAKAEKLSSAEKMQLGLSVDSKVDSKQITLESLMAPVSSGKPLTKGTEPSTAKPQTSAEVDAIVSAPMGDRTMVAVSAQSKAPVSVPVSAQSEFTPFKDENKAKESNVAVDAADLMLSREIQMDNSNGKESSGSVVKSGSALGSASDTRLSDDSVKMLADKIESLKDNGSSTLRVVLNQDANGKIEIRVQKIAGELRVHLSSDSKEMSKALEGSKAELVTQLNDRVKFATVEIGSEVHRVASESSQLNSLKNVLNSSDVIRMGQTNEAKLNLASSSSDFSSSDFSGKQNHEFREQQGREESRERSMKKWQGVFEEKESA